MIKYVSSKILHVWMLHTGLKQELEESVMFECFMSVTKMAFCLDLN